MSAVLALSFEVCSVFCACVVGATRFWAKVLALISSGKAL